MKSGSIKINYIYNLSFQVFAMITPLITTPYVSRVLLADGVGRISFSSSVITYFGLFASLGFSTYAQREIAKKQGDKKQQSKIFWEIVICRSFTTLISIFLCLGLVYIETFGAYSILIGIMSIELVGQMFNIAFYFQGNEQFKIIAIRDFIIRIIGVALIFLLVHKPEDIKIYAMCNSGMSLFSALILWLNVKKELVRIDISNLTPFAHFIPSLSLFIPTIAISLFTVFDKILMGLLIPGTVLLELEDGTEIVKRVADIENGYYSQSEKIIKLSMMVLASLSIVMMPRNSKILEDGNYKKFNDNIRKAIEFVFFIGAPISAEIIGVAKNFSPWFFGPGYDKVPFLMIMFAFVILPAGLGNVLGQQYLIPKGEDRKYIIVYVISGLVNLGLNVLFIPKLFSYGAAMASIIAECIAPIMMFFYLRDRLSFVFILKNNWKPLVASFFMGMIVYYTGDSIESSICNTCLLIFEGIMIYFSIMILLKSDFLLGYMRLIRKNVIIGGK